MDWYETIGQQFLMNCSKIDHSYEAFTYLFVFTQQTKILLQIFQNLAVTRKFV